MSTPKQRQQIGMLRKMLCFDEDTYKDILGAYGVASSKDLPINDASELIDALRKNAISRGILKPTKKYAFQRFKYDNLGIRPGMATPKQLRMIEAMWYRVSRQTNDTDRAKALDVYVKKITNKDHMKFLTPLDIRKLVRALNNTKK